MSFKIEVVKRAFFNLDDEFLHRIKTARGYKTIESTVFSLIEDLKEDNQLDKMFIRICKEQTDKMNRANKMMENQNLTAENAYTLLEYAKEIGIINPF